MVWAVLGVCFVVFSILGTVKYFDNEDRCAHISMPVAPIFRHSAHATLLRTTRARTQPNQLAICREHTHGTHLAYLAGTRGRVCDRSFIPLQYCPLTPEVRW